MVFVEKLNLILINLHGSFFAMALAHCTSVYLAYKPWDCRHLLFSMQKSIA